MNIRERLECITPLLELPSHQVTLYDNVRPFALPRACPPLVIKSPHLMQVLGLPPDLARVLYNWERSSAQAAEHSVERTPVGSADLWVSYE